MKSHYQSVIPVRVVLSLCLLLGLGRPGSELQAAVLIRDPHGITGFDLHAKGAIWWRNQGICGGEFAFEARVNTRYDFGWGAPDDFKILASSCTMLPDIANNAVRDSAYAYFFENGQLWKKSVSAATTNPLQALFSSPVNLPTGQDGSFLWEDRGWLFWGAYTSGTGLLEIKKARVNGTGGQNVATIPGAGAPIKRMRLYHYSTGGEARELYVILLTNGRLYTRIVESATFAVQALQETGISDFAVKFVSGRDTATPYLYAAQGTSQISPSTPAGRLYRINVVTEATTTIFQATDQHQVLAVEVDPDVVNGSDNVYLTLGIVSGNPIPLVGELALYRNDLPGADGTWDLILGQNAGLNLRSNGKRLHYLAGNQIVDISTEAPPVMLDLKALGLEVTQFLQNLNNDQPLIANKEGTHVRAYATLLTNTTPFASYFPDARLRVWLNGNELAGSPFSPVNNIAVTSTNDLAALRTNLNTSFLFKLPKLSVGLLTASFTVNPNHTILETGNSPYANNAIATSGTIDVVSSATPCLVAVPVPTPFGKYETWFGSFPNILRRAESMLPVEKFDLRFWGSLLDGHDPLSGTTYFIFPFGGVNSDDEQDNDALDAIDCLRESSNYPEGCDLAHWVGMVHPGVANFGGLGRRPGAALIASMSGSSFNNSINGPAGGEILAHELAHNYGLPHVSCACNGGTEPKAPNPFYPGDFCSLIEFGKVGYRAFDPITQRQFGLDEAADLMSYACSKWPSTYTWNFILGRLQAAVILPFAAQGAGINPVLPTAPVIFMAGSIKTNVPLARFGTFLQMPAGHFNLIRVHENIEESERESGVPGHFSARMLDLIGNVLHESGLPLEETTDGPDEDFAFSHYFPFPPGTQRIQIVQGQQILAERIVSSHPPAIALTTVTMDEAQQQLTASWQASDPDGGHLVFWIYYSPDDGRAWQALALNRRQTSVVIDTRRLPASITGRLRVVASDGVRATAAVSPRFVISNHPPEIGLSGLSEGARIPYDNRPSLSIFAVDAEEGRAPISLQWWIQKVNGPTLNGTGNDIAMEELDIGEHQLTIAATDRANAISQITRRFAILPPTVADGPEPELDGACADTGYRMATLIQVPSGTRGKLPVRLLHANGRLYVSFGELAPGVGRVPAKAGIRIDLNGDGSVQPQVGDRGFLVLESGEPLQETALRETLVPTLSPSTLFEPLVEHGGNGWCAELQIDDSLIGGWNHLARVMIEASGNVWPVNADKDSPATWAPIWLGTAPPAPQNQTPIAHAGQDQLLNTGAGAQVVLSGDNSHDPDGDPLTFQWSQSAGPAVALSNASAVNPSFELTGLSNEVELQFSLTVSDGQTSSVPDQVLVRVKPSAVLAGTPPRASLSPEGIYSGVLQTAPGDRRIVQATSDFSGWINIYTNSADAFGLLDFIDADSPSFRWRFYRGVRE